MSERPVTRRGLLGLAGASALTAGLSACSIRLESGAPEIPGIPTQGPPADTAALQATVRSRKGLLESLATPTAGLQAQLRSAYQAQLTRLQAVMASAGIPEPTASGTGGSSQSPGASGTSAATPASTAPFQTVLDRTVDNTTFARIAAVGTAYTPMLASISAVDAAALTASGGSVSWPTTSVPSEVAAALLPAVREAVYGLEVIAAKTALTGRARVTATLHTMYPIRTQLEALAGDAAPPLHSTYVLTPDPSTDQARTALGQHLLTSVVAACADQAEATKGSANHVAALLRIWATVLAASWTWGVAPVAFPGLTG